MLAVDKYLAPTVRETVGKYLQTFSHERGRLVQLVDQLTLTRDLLDRDRPEHVVVGDLILHPSEGRVLLELYTDSRGEARMAIPHFHVDPYHAEWARLFSGVTEIEKLERTADFMTFFSIIAPGAGRQKVFGDAHYLFDIRQTSSVGDRHRSDVHQHWEFTFVRQAKVEFEVQTGRRGEYVWASIAKLLNSDRPELLRLGLKLKKLGLDKAVQHRSLR
jgi:hypothetical protein